MTYELTFFGSATANYFPRRYRRYHNTVESVRETIEKVFSQLKDRGCPTASHTPVVLDRATGKQVTLPQE